MANTFFKFKQFIIHQDRCAMKVCTDACLFGAMVSNNISKYKNALDIGTGTGLLSLMFAQNHSESFIDAVEIDDQAYNQVKQNIDESIFKKQIQIYLSDIKSFYPKKKYDIIFSNPPFFKNDLKSSDAKRNIALHSSCLSFDDLVAAVDRLLKPNAIFFVLLPFTAENEFIKTCSHTSLFPFQITRIKQTPKHNYFRIVIGFGRKENAILINEIILKQEDNEYTNEFKNLLKAFYLNF